MAIVQSLLAREMELLQLITHDVPAEVRQRYDKLNDALHAESI